MVIRSSSSSGIPFGNTAGRPTAASGQPYFNGETARLELYTATGWQNIVQETPGVSSVSGNYSESANSGVITILGTNFVSGCYATAIGTNGVQVDATSTTFNSLVQAVATFTGLSNAYEPYDIKVTNPSNLFGMLPDALYVNASPVWVTAAGSLGTFADNVAISVSATATDDSTITYSLANGSALPSGITLNSSSGLISGTLPDVSTNTTYNFTINATDGVNTTISRAFSFVQNAASVWSTSAGSLGTFLKQSSITLTALSATDSDTVTYALASGSSLPSGISLNSATGVISGTLPDIATATTYTFTINALDGINTTPRTFTLTSTLPVLAKMLIVAGGGGGGTGPGEGGGGGAGGLVYYGTETPKTVNGSTVSLSPGTQYTVTVGAGGLGGSIWTSTPNGTNGNDSSVTGGSLSLIVAKGGGRGGCYPLYFGVGADGGSGGGGGGNTDGNNGANSGGTAVSGQGNNGSAGKGAPSPYQGGGGGGAGAAGSIPHGGNGLTYSITGSSSTYAGGGGGSSNGGTNGNGGSGGGGNGYGSGTSYLGTPNTGGGGGSNGSNDSNRATGGSGIVVINAGVAASSTTGSPSNPSTGVYIFTGTGSITF